VAGGNLLKSGLVINNQLLIYDYINDKMFLTLFDNIVPKSPDLTMTVRRKEKKMGMPQTVLTKKIPLWGDPGTEKESLVGTKKEVLEVLSRVMGESQSPWLDLVLYTGGRGSTGPYVNNIYIFGKREVIVCNLRKIAERISVRKGWKKEGVWIGFSTFGKPRIEDLT